MTILKFSTLTAAAGLFIVTACTDINTPTGNDKTRTGEGAALGALSGAALGAIIAGNSKNRAESAVIGAVIGGVAGGLIGNQLDKQAADLESQFSNDRIQIINDGEKLVVVMPQDILFAIDSTAVKPALQSDLGVLARSLDVYPDSTVMIFGHTDNTGTAEHNQILSEGRAASVSSILVAKGVASGRVRSRGKGEENPITSNLTPEGRAQNRRVEIIIRPDL
ncbi:MAG: OmpA family protein [Paracoccaceae bacterium]